MKRALYLFFICIQAYGVLSAQEIGPEFFRGMAPRNIGPGGMSGRVTAIDVVLSDADVMYVGTASGGVWKSTDGGIKWYSIFDEEATASIGAIAVQQSNPDVIWVGTGEGNPRNSVNGGYGIYKSLDGGKTWNCMGLEKTRHIHRIIIDPTDADVVYVGAIGSPWGAHPERGVYKTTDGGKTWEKILFVNDRTGVGDMVMDPSNPNKLIVGMWEHKRDPWYFESGGEGSGLYISYDGGAHWEERDHKSGLPKGKLGRIGLAIARNKPNIVYALVESKKNALYKSTDGGVHFKKVNDKGEIGNRPFYYSDIFVDPENENRIYSVFTYVNVSEDGGAHFRRLMPAYGVDNGIHPDHHAWWIHPEDGSFIIDGNDGGLNISRDGGAHWRFVGNLPVAQFYHIAVDNELPYNVYGGMQDNGSWCGPSYVWKVQGIRNGYWQEISFGDGFDVVPDPEDSRYGWSMSQQGYVLRYDRMTGNNYTVRPTPADPDTKLRFNWNAAIDIDPFDPNTLYFGSQFVHRSRDKGLTWEIISPDLTTNDTSKQKQHLSGGLTIDATGAENYTTITVIEASPIAKDMLWVGTDDGRVHYTIDGGKNWTDVTKHLKGLPTGSWVCQIKASNKNEGAALLVANDYRRHNYEPYVFRTEDYGRHWERIVHRSDVISYALSIVEDPEEKNLLFLGTDDGLYVSIDAGGHWTKWDKGFPTVPVSDLVIHPREHDLVIGTFGRAAWIIDDIRPLRAIAREQKIDKRIKVFDPPTAYLASYQQPAGSRFGGDALFNGTNRKRGAMISYYVKLNPKKEEQQPKEKGVDDKKKTQDSIFLKIFQANRLIRTLRIKAPDSSGLYRTYWQLDEAGVPAPSRKIKKSSAEPGGVRVKPGNYTIKMYYLQDSSASQIEVRKDPRIDLSQRAIDARYDVGKKLEAHKALCTSVVKQLIESKTTAREIKNKLQQIDKKAYADQINHSDSVIYKIDSLVSVFIGKEDKRQGITRDPELRIIHRLQRASWYAGSRPDGLTETEKRLIRFAEDDLDRAIKGVNQFFEKDWSRYRAHIESMEWPLFKATHDFKLERK